MAVINREEFFERTKTLFGDRDDEELIRFYEDMGDTFDNFSSDEDWKSKYEKNDANWRKKYKERFENKEVKVEKKNKTKEDVKDDDEKTTYEELFSEEVK